MSGDNSSTFGFFFKIGLLILGYFMLLYVLGVAARIVDSIPWWMWIGGAAAIVIFAGANEKKKDSEKKTPEDK